MSVVDCEEVAEAFQAWDKLISAIFKTDRRLAMKLIDDMNPIWGDVDKWQNENQ